MKYRKQQIKIVDRRVKLLTEIISNIRAVKLYAYEQFFGKRISMLREDEVKNIRKNGLYRATVMASFRFIPILAAVCECPHALCGNLLITQ
jgi:ATP-binding cassette subfamily C (CFTR/MRP) protein 1